jgi:hypothetical protein
MMTIAAVLCHRHHRDAHRSSRFGLHQQARPVTILTATKLTAAQLISFVLREYLPSMPLTPQTFVQRVLSVHGRKEIYRDHETVVFYANPRDPHVTQALRDACERISRRDLRRDGRRLRFVVEQAPIRSA